MDVSWMIWIKQALLAVSTVYFYVTAIGLTYGWRIGILASPAAFAVMGIVLVSALLLEALLVWWHVRKRLLWGALGLLAYAVIGFVAAPVFFGAAAIWISLVLPVVVVFLGGFVYVFAHLLIHAILPRRALQADDIAEALRTLPGWKIVDRRLTKTYRCISADDALRFADACEVVATARFSRLRVMITGADVAVSLWTPDVGGILLRDVEVARELDRR